MSAVEVPVELISESSILLEVISSVAWAAPTDAQRSYAAELSSKLRALLPQPAPTCPNCGHVPVGHGDGGCLASACECPFSNASVVVALSLLAAERDSKPAQRQPRVWNAGDPDPGDVEQIRDRDGDVWTRAEAGWWTSPETREMTWEHIARKWSPLTEVLPGGAS